MSVRSFRQLLPIILLVLASAPAAACFGPKLYVGVAVEPRQDALYALVTLYVQEKTGVESERVTLVPGEEPAQALAAERVDLAFAAVPPAGATTLLAIAGYPVLASGARPLSDLQFTTVVPALRKLAALLTPRDLQELEARVAAGEKPLAAARRLCMERRWL